MTSIKAIYGENDVILTTFTISLTKLKYNKILIHINSYLIDKQSSKTVVIPLMPSNQYLMMV